MKGSTRAAATRLLILLLTLTLATGSAAAKPGTLEFGSRGAEVLRLQKALVSLGFDPNGTDGKFGRGTERAVTAYQQARGLEADGKAGTLTLTTLYKELESGGGASGGGTPVATPVATNPNTLKYGDSGDRVRELQTALVKLGYSTNGVDGSFGASTQRAVIAFQKAVGLTADGLAGERTLDKLFSMASSGGSSSGAGSDGGSSSSSSDGELTRTLRKGYTGSDVKRVQERLKELDYYTGSIDGVYGTGSIAAVKAFQRRNGLTADGLAGQNTFTRLFSSSAVSAGGSSSGESSDSASGGTGAYITLRPGDTGDGVRKLQRALKDLDYSVTVDGSYGSNTVSAVSDFQLFNGLEADGVAGAKTQSLLYSGNAKKYSSSGSGESSGSGTASGSSGVIAGPSQSQVKLLHWFNDVKGSLSTGSKLIAYDPSTGISWTLRVMSRGNHADVEPLTAADTQAMFEAFGNRISWGPKVVYVQLPDGRWSLAATHNVAHGTQTISGNNFDGQNCVHFLRDMSECQQNDPNYGVQNQQALRKYWKQMTGETVE